jgi:hypothetical protein
VTGGAPRPGALLFVRYAYPPNALGYCGPPDSTTLRDYGAAGVVDPDLTRLARTFAGAWPYLELIAAHAGIADPLDRRVVEAYWVGNRLLDRVSSAGDAVLVGGVAHHSFHVLCVYPWVGLLVDGRGGAHALSVLDQCRIRWGRVVAVHGDRVTVESRPLTWDGHRLDLGEPVTETAETSVVGATRLGPGDWVSLHWQWVCDRLSTRQRQALSSYTKRHLDLVNRRIAGRDGAEALRER